MNSICLSCGTTLSNKSICSTCSTKRGVEGVNAANAANLLEQTQVNKFHTKGGHGFAAEDANALADKFDLKKVDQVGVSNEVNGADRISNGIKIQTKYCKTPVETVEAAFESKGLYRYENQLLEVPSDQYEECIKLMQEKISQGRVNGVVDPKEAERIIKKGAITYKQARNIAKAGNIDSLLYDTKTQSITATYAFGISFAIQFTKNLLDGQKTDEALKAALNSAIASGTTSFITGIITSQILRTKISVAGVAVSRGIVRNVVSSNLGRSTVQNLAKSSLGRAVYGAAATNHIARLLRTNAITALIAVTVLTIPDLYRASIKGSISWKQFFKNLLVNLVGVIGGIFGWIIGAILGAIVGSVVPFIGTAIVGFLGGLIGGIIGGSVVTIAAKAILDLFIDDDAKETLTIVDKALNELITDFLLSEKEIAELSHCLEKSLDQQLLRTVYIASRKKQDALGFVYNRFEPLCEKIVAQRPQTYLPKLETVESEIEAILVQSASG